jgi:hypothetical protein
MNGNWEELPSLMHQHPIRESPGPLRETLEAGQGPLREALLRLGKVRMAMVLHLSRAF